MIINFMIFAGSIFGFPTWYEYLPLNPTDNTPEIRGLGDIWLIVAAIIDILLRVAALAAIALVVVGSVQYITSQGEPAKTTKARTTIISALAGLVIAVLAVTLITFLAGQFKSS
jgi:archaellum biogenesis protein FlaJ (TadC family)